MDAGVQSWRLLKLRFLFQALRISGANLSVTKYRSAPVFFDFVDRNAWAYTYKSYFLFVDWNP